jgi:hypothetical protein
LTPFEPSDQLVWLISISKYDQVIKALADQKKQKSPKDPLELDSTKVTNLPNAKPDTQNVL